MFADVNKKKNEFGGAECEFGGFHFICSADILVCGFGRLSSRQFEHGTGKSREPAGWKACATSKKANPERRDSPFAF
jgi:hypothetical protein